MTTNHPLITQWPTLAGQLPIVRLGDWPTPVRCCDQQRNIWVKHEDLSSSLYGGNKVRKLELLLAENKKPVLTYGVMGSHHILATALHARSLERGCTAIVTPQHWTEHHRQVHRLVLEACERVIPIDQPLAMGQGLVALARQVLRREMLGYCLVPAGGTSPRGVLGFVGAGLELAEQIRRGDCPKPAKLFVPLGTGGTAVGLALGLALAEIDTEVVAVRVAPRLFAHQRRLAHFANKALELMNRAGTRLTQPNLRLRVEHRFIGEGYAFPSTAAEYAVSQAAELGLELETTYSGKAFAALLTDLRADRSGTPRLFVNTYGPIDGLSFHTVKEKL